MSDGKHTPTHDGAPLDSVCPLCGSPVTFDQAEQIEAEMESDRATCSHCYMTFGEARATQASGDEG